MNEDLVILIFMIFMMLLFCCHGGLLLFFCSFLRRRNITELRFIQTLMLSFTANIKDFYKIFYTEYSKEHNASLSKALIISHITFVILIFVSPVLLAIYIGI